MSRMLEVLNIGTQALAKFKIEEIKRLGDSQGSKVSSCQMVASCAQKSKEIIYPEKNRSSKERQSSKLSNAPIP